MLGRAFRLEVVDIDDVELDLELLEWVGMSFIEEHAALPLARTRTSITLAERVLIDAVEMGSSDIHIEPNGSEQSTLIRFRIDGNCEVYKCLPPAVRQPLITRMKILVEMDIAERRKPQDGKIKFRTRDKHMVLRVLASSKPIPLEDMGFKPRNLAEVNRIMKPPNGMVLCVGPTGSGKTTTLHSALNSINSVDRGGALRDHPARSATGAGQATNRLRLGKDEVLSFWEAPGCTTCRGSGYTGRLAVHELSEAIQTTLRMDGIEKAARGLTDLRQVISVCGD